MERRGFLKGLAAAFPAATCAVSGAGALADAGFLGLATELRELTDEAKFWRKVRAQFLLRPGLVHLNTGTLGSVPRRVLDEVASLASEIEGDPASNVFGDIGHRMEEVRARAAAFLGATLDEVALIENTTSGMNAVAQGIAHELRPGDEILTTNHEHPGGLVCWEYLAKQIGIKIVPISMPAPVESKAQVLQLVQDNLTSRTRICCFSHVETITGLVMPLAEISEITRPRGILLACDGAQAPGMLQVDVKALGVDTYASSSHKWMLAPKGSGLLYIRKDAQERVRPMVLSSGYQAYTAATGTRDVSHILGHGAAMEFHEAVGRGKIEDRCRSLAGTLRRRFSELDQLRLLTPTEPELTGGIVTFGLKTGKNGEVFTRLLQEHQIAVKVAAKPEYNALRFSTHLYNDEDEIDRTARALRVILGS
ncbi:aminotransferase class V-fold PLP-dependent enzyme [Isosphaeraceae bacterium EP7]